MNRCKFFPLLSANNCSIRCSYKFILHYPISLCYCLESKMQYRGICYWLEAFTTLASGVVFFYRSVLFPVYFVCFMVKTFPNFVGCCGKPIVTCARQLVTGLSFSQSYLVHGSCSAEKVLPKRVTLQAHALRKAHHCFLVLGKPFQSCVPVSSGPVFSPWASLLHKAGPKLAKHLHGLC